MNHAEKLQYMTHTPLPKLVGQLATPAVISMLISSLYNMADTYFVGQIGSASATGAVGVIFPVMSLMQAVGFMFGHGSGNFMSRALGAGQVEKAEKMAATGFFSAFFAGLLIMAAGLMLPGQICSLLGSTETILPYAVEYLRYLMPGAPFLVAQFVINNQLRFQGSAFYGMIGVTVGALLNVALDPVFIFVLGMGVSGAALATSISQFVGFTVLLCMTYQKGNIPIRLRHFTPSLANYREIFRGGVPSLARQALTSVSTIVLNNAAGVYGDAAIAAMSIVGRVMMMGNSAIIGFGQGFQPICGFNYGAKRYARVREAFWFCVKLCFVALVVIAVLGMIFAPQIIGLLIKSNPEVVEIGTLSLRLQCIFWPLFSYVIIANMMLQTIGMAGKATLLAVARQGLFFIPTVLLLSWLLGLLGVQMSQAVADVLSFALAVPIGQGVLRRFKQLEAERGNGPDMQVE
ncbi:MAG: MATE family efflux transporter [Clostridia bacterium]|nr:MATE family efflux transporter [Clostridia bacterium]